MVGHDIKLEAPAPVARSAPEFPAPDVLRKLGVEDRALLEKLVSEAGDFVDHPALHESNADVRIFGVAARLTHGNGTRFPAPAPLAVSKSLSSARVPTLWLYASNDSFFRPDLARAMASAWQSGGGKAELHVFPPYGSDGHNLADDRAGWDVWGDAVDRFMSTDSEPPVASLEGETAPVQTGAVTPAPLTASANGETHAP